MKEFIEEYGGVVAACLLGLLLIGCIASLLSADGALHELVAAFFYELGAVPG